MIWLALLIPTLTVIFVAWKFPKKIHVIEYILLFGIPIICIFVGKSCSIHSQTKDIEFWNSYGVQAIYEEEWRERWTEIETYTVTVGSGKNARTETRTRTVTKRRTHPEKWILQDNISKSHKISKNHFERLCKLWENRTFKNMQRRRNTSHTITKDGNAYITIYDKIFEHTVPICKQHTYENKIQCSKSIFNFQNIDDEIKNQYKLFEYPKENLFGFNPIIGYSSPVASKTLSIYNSRFGSIRQLHMMLLVFNGQPLETALYQEAYWKGGNKNEFIVCVGLDKNKIKWTKVISWTENEILKITTARKIKEMKEFDVVKIVKYMGDNIPNKFIRKQFEDFSYISVQPTTTAVLITYGVTLLVSIIIAIISIINDFGLESSLRKRKY